MMEQKSILRKKTNNCLTYTKNEKAITLIALVITIIVLLILAGVSIAMLTGDNGILTQSNEAKITNIEGRVKEEMNLAVQAAKLAAESKAAKDASYSAEANLSEVQTELEKDLKPTAGYTVTTSTGKVKIEYAGEDYKKATKNNEAKISVEITVSGNGFTVPEPTFSR